MEPSGMKRLARRVTIGIFVGMLVLTGVSRTIYYAITPQVTVAMPASRALAKQFSMRIGFDYPEISIAYMDIQLPVPLVLESVNAKADYAYAKGDVAAMVNMSSYRAAADAYAAEIEKAEAALSLFDLDRAAQQNTLNEQNAKEQKAYQAERKRLSDTLQAARDALARLQNGTPDKAFAREISLLEDAVNSMQAELSQNLQLLAQGIVTQASIDAAQKAVEDKRAEITFKREQYADNQLLGIDEAKAKVTDLERQLSTLDADSPMASAYTITGADAARRQALADAIAQAEAAYDAFRAFVEPDGSIRFREDCVAAELYMTRGGAISGREKLYAYAMDYRPSFRAEVTEDLFFSLNVQGRFGFEVNGRQVQLLVDRKENKDGAYALLLSPVGEIDEYVLNTIRTSGAVASPVSLETQYYQTVVPVAALGGKAAVGGAGQVYVLDTRKSYFGDEQFVTAVDVTVVDANDEYAAIAAKGGNQLYNSVVVVKWSEPLGDGAAVVVRE